MDPSSEASGSTPSLPPLVDLLRKSVKRTRTVYLSEVSQTAEPDEQSYVPSYCLDWTKPANKAGQVELTLTSFLPAHAPPSVARRCVDRSKAALLSKLSSEYKDSQTLPPSLAAMQANGAGPKKPKVADGHDRTSLMIEDVGRAGSKADRLVRTFNPE